MGFLLKEALKSLCGVNQWSYAVFWKIGCQNPKIVGRAAFTGKHQWILSENYTRDAHPPEVLNEVHHQFSAGMQTVAVIPVLPHGVIQFGSSLAIMENAGFVNDVKSLILQLGCVPGALLSESYAIKETSQNIGEPISVAASIYGDPSRNYEVTNSSPFIADGCDQQSNSSQASRLVGQPSHSIMRQIQDNQPINASTFHSPNLIQTLVKSHADQCQQKLPSVMKPKLSFRSQLESEVAKAEVITSNPDVWLNRHGVSYNARFGFNHQPSVGPSGSSASNPRLMENQVLSDAGARGHINNNLSGPSCFLSSQLRTNGGLDSDSHKSSDIAPFLGEGVRMGNYLRSISIPPSVLNTNKSADISLSCTQLTGIGLQNADSLKSEVIPLSDQVDHLNISHMLSGDSDHRHHLTNEKCTEKELVPRRQKIENDLFQALGIPLTRADAQMILSEHVPDFLHEFPKPENGSQTPRSKNAIHEDTCVRPASGDDLFDILGVDFKSKLFNGYGNDSVIDGPGTSSQNLCKDSSTSMTFQDTGSDFYPISEGISDSGIFVGSDADHLLEAVVSRIHSATKQSSDDNVSCRTTLTKISSSSVPSTSPTYGRGNMSDQMQRNLFGLPPEKSGTMGSSSFRSGCSKDERGNCSQGSSIYGSQISSWVEQGHSLKRESSVSTAYSKRPDEIGKSNRKRFKPGENPRPRPKDRQMIQDRVKELREIVPNGAKCSIDALLERTIKHMLFLQSVMKHADKLKQTGESKIINKEGGLHLKDNFEGGATWAFEVGSQSMVCPIIVEDLNPPRQMLVEMLCEERGFFLEIADIIRGMGLTILKGVMETRNDKIWARFTVEANRDVTRMEIFISLVHLLEQTVKGSTLSAHGIDNDNMMVHHSFHQAASIPATGRASSFQ
ncbi:transcription factor LHW isoform X2 [Vitis vinifera]|uniref:transcription factor LHW isoform X2 n=1 Tax=Vitis vinifera TaxID=29760 RepID=UPI002882F050|nr:transcription factor LHW isoform X2 [Vitis vinifera]